MANAVPGDELLAGVAPPAPSLGDLGLSAQTRAGGGQVRAERVNKPTKRPFRTHGKVFLTQGGVNFVCSGTAVRSKIKRLVATAGHCTYSQAMGGYATNFMFAPAYDGGPSRFGEWTARKLKATKQWENSEDLRYDVAMATMAKRNNGKKLQQVVGARGMTFNKGHGESFDMFGYPAEGRFNGQRMWTCDTDGDGSDQSMARPRPTRVSCDMTGGSSGGGWVTGRRGKVNSVVSYGYECIVPLPGEICENEEEGNLFGPYFGDVAKKLYRSQKR